jgi:hypothetical protein
MPAWSSRGTDVVTVSVTGVGIAAPGLRDWDAARAVLAGKAAYAEAPLEHRAPDALPAAERRRAGAVTRLALAVAQEAVARARADGATLASVFASADGDADNLHQICLALAAPAPEISPTRFHNSVQNAPSGYWTIAMQARAPTTSINGLDDVFAAGLLEAAVQAATEERAVLLVAYDLPPPEPLNRLHPTAGGGAVALVLSPEKAVSGRGSTLALEVIAAGAAPVSPMPEPALEGLRLASPATRGLPLLRALARAGRAATVLGLDDHNALRVASDG